MTPEAVGKLLEVHEAANNPFLPFEDIYVTGMHSYYWHEFYNYSSNYFS